MQFYNTVRQWGAVAKFLHWTIALLIIGLLIVGNIMEGMANSPLKFQIYAVHKSIGITVLALMVARLAWRFVNPTPALPTNLKGYERALAHLTHWGFYAVAIATPIAGWVISSAANFPVKWFGLVTLPNLVGPNRETQELAEAVHGTLGWVIVALLALHIAAVVKHHVMLKDMTLVRMLPGSPRARFPNHKEV